ncbi:MAG TPA: SMC family ATPase [Crinalium sp.]
MEILSITLKNFKSHSDRHFQFQPGTNAICGENGAGKTSILEAIAWTLFNYRGAYKNEDLIRNGAGSAQAMIAFISNQDGRTYEIQRCTTKGYTIYDPQLDQRLEYKHIEEEVMPWLRQHLGVAPGTDLGKLFANTIGVPQGTFTADFLQAPEKRKPIFDAILKVEEYRQANQELLGLEKYAKVEVESLERAIAQYDETLRDLEPLQQRRQTLSNEIAQEEATLHQLQTTLATLQVEKDALTAQAKQVQQLETKLQQLSVQAEGKRQANHLLEQTVERAKQAVEVCELNRPGYNAFLQAEMALKDLGQQTKQRQTLLKQRESKQKLLIERQTEFTKLTLQLEQLSKAQADIEQLQPAIQQQLALEQQQTAIADQFEYLHTCKLEYQTLTKQLTKFQTEQTKLINEIEKLRSLEAVVTNIPELEQRRDRIQEQLSRIEAAKQFEADLRQLVNAGEEKRDRHQIKADQALEILRSMQQTVPLLATASVDSALDAIQAGVDLNTELLHTLHYILADLAEQTSVAKLKQQSYELKLQLEGANRQRAEVLNLPAKLEQQLNLRDEIEQIQQHLQHLQAQLATELDWQERRSHLSAQLMQLSDPRGRAQLLARELQQQSRIQESHAQLQRVQIGIQNDIAQLDAQLLQFDELETQIEHQQQQKQIYQPNYLTYLQHQKDAENLPALEADLEVTTATLQQLTETYLQLKTEYDQIAADYDPQRYQQIESLYTETRSQTDRILGSLPQQRKLLNELDTQLASLNAVAEKRDRAQVDLKQRERIRRFITFARKTYKEAGPRIAERYVQAISREADRLFRELMNRPNVALEWNREYEILIQEGAHNRRFINLSGGEQMCAALAVRLALLRVLADIDIAFFDEPTTNMDRPRRESLAEAIANIKTFRQLFVISHDDTFEKVTENVIFVEREPG